MAELPNTTILLPPKPTMGDMDERRIRRLYSNRVSAQKARLRKYEHVLQLEDKVKKLEEHKKLLSAQVDHYNFKQMTLKTEINSARERLALLTNASMLKNAETENLRREIVQLKQLIIY